MSLILLFSFYSLICFDRRLVGDTGNVALMSIDGTDFRINEPQPFSTIWYSHNFKGPGLRYEIGFNIKQVTLYGSMNIF